MLRPVAEGSNPDHRPTSLSPSRAPAPLSVDPLLGRVTLKKLLNPSSVRLSSISWKTGIALTVIL